MDELKNTAAQAAGAAVAAEDEVVTFKRPSQAKEIWRRFRKNRGSMIGLIILIIIFLLLHQTPKDMILIYLLFHCLIVQDLIVPSQYVNSLKIIAYLNY